MSKVYIVPFQTSKAEGALENVNWVPERDDVKFDIWLFGDDPFTFSAEWSSDNSNYSVYDEEELAYYYVSTVAENSYALTASSEEDPTIVSVPDTPIAVYYEVDDPEPDPDQPKPDNIDFNTCSKNVVINADGSKVQVRSSQNWMDRLEKSVSGADSVDYRNRSVGKYLDVMDGREDLSPVITITKDITRYEPEPESDNNSEQA